MEVTNAPELSVIVPVYKEAKNIQSFLQTMENVLGKLSLSYEIVFCLDPSHN